MVRNRKSVSKRLVCYAFIDAANLFYGGRKSLGWSIDYRKLLKYLKNKFGVKKLFYYARVEINNFPYDPLAPKPIDLERFLGFLLKKLNGKPLSRTQITLLKKHIQRVKFYRKLKSFGYTLRLKPTKIYKEGNRTIKKANCDVDMAFDLMRYMSQYQKLIILSGDGDFAIVLRYLKSKKKKIRILARSERTAKEIKRLAGKNFMDFHYLREQLKFEEGDEKEKVDK